MALGYIDYGAKVGNAPGLVLVMRKKRLAFAKFSFIMAIVSLFLVDTPTSGSVGALAVGQLWTTLKMGTQIGHHLTPDRFFVGRTYLSFYNLLLLAGLFWKLRDARQEKKNMEFQFF